MPKTWVGWVESAPKGRVFEFIEAQGKCSSSPAIQGWTIVTKNDHQIRCVMFENSINFENPSYISRDARDRKKKRLQKNGQRLAINGVHNPNKWPCKLVTRVFFTPIIGPISWSYKPTYNWLFRGPPIEGFFFITKKTSSDFAELGAGSFFSSM